MLRTLLVAILAVSSVYAQIVSNVGRSAYVSGGVSPVGVRSVGTAGGYGGLGVSGLRYGSSYGLGGYGLGSGVYGSGYGLGSGAYGSGYGLGNYGSYGGYGGYGLGTYGVGLGGVRSVGIAAPAVSVAAAPAVGVAGLGISRGVGVGAYGYGASQAVTPVNAAVISSARQVDYRTVPNVGEIPVPQVVDVPPTEQPVQINFLSKSSPLLVSQAHIAGEPGQVQFTESEDEPHRLIHSVTKPVVQEVREIVQPYRQVLQEINPVIEQTGTIVTQGEGGARLSGIAGGIVGQGGVIGQAAGLQTANVGAVGVARPVAVGGLGLANSGVVGIGGVRSVGSLGTYGGYGGLGGYGLGYGTGLLTGGIRTVGTGLYGSGLYGSGYGSGSGSGSGYGSGLYGSGVYGSGLYGSGLYGANGLYGSRALNLGGLYNNGVGYQFIRRR